MDEASAGASAAPLPAPPARPRPGIEAVQRDIALANTYRIELIKFVLAITAALFAFTVSFRPTLWQVVVPEAMWIAWGGLALSMLGGLFHMEGWDHFYKSYRDFDHRGRFDQGKRARRGINVWRRAGMVVQYAGFVIGVAGVAVFAGANLDHARPPGDPAGLPAAATPPARPAS
jgi:hypothetical protein